MTDALVSLADLKGWGVRFEWYEALAIVQSLAQTIGESATATGPATLELGNIFISSSGGVTAATGPQQSATAVPRVAQILGEILPDFHRRTTFHSVLVKAASDPPGYASLEEWFHALAPFERPDRAEIIQGVYRRGRKVGPLLFAEPRAVDLFVPETARTETPANESILDEADASTSKGRRRRQTMLVLQALAAVAVVATIVSLGVWMVRRQGGRPGAAPGQASSIAAPVETAQAPATDGSVTEPSVTAHDSAATSVKPSAPERSVWRARAEQAPPTTAEASGPTPAAVPGQDSPGSSARSSAGGSLVMPSPRDPDPSPPAAAGARTYSAKDLDVVPPAAEYPQQIWRQPTNPPLETPMTIELIVNESGAVESVRALRLPDDLSEAMALTMSLSVVKTWHFRPALKNDRPVKYRQLISVTLR